MSFSFICSKVWQPLDQIFKKELTAEDLLYAEIANIKGLSIPFKLITRSKNSQQLIHFNATVMFL